MRSVRSIVEPSDEAPGQSAVRRPALWTPEPIVLMKPPSPTYGEAIIGPAEAAESKDVQSVTHWRISPMAKCGQQWRGHTVAAECTRPAGADRSNPRLADVGQCGRHCSPKRPPATHAH